MSYSLREVTSDGSLTKQSVPVRRLRLNGHLLSANVRGVASEPHTEAIQGECGHRNGRGTETEVASGDGYAKYIVTTQGHYHGASELDEGNDQHWGSNISATARWRTERVR